MVVADPRHAGSDFSKTYSDLAIQLSLDPEIASVRYVASLPLFDLTVPVNMFVAQTDDGRIAFDIVDARPERNLDDDGLLLLTLHKHDVRLAEIDCATIEREPLASNCRKIWRHRNQHVEASLVAAVDRAVAEGAALTIRTLGRTVRLRYPMRTVCALICRKRLQTDFDKRRLDLQSIVRRLDRAVHAADRIEPEAPIVEPTNVAEIKCGETK